MAGGGGGGGGPRSPQQAPEDAAPSPARRRSERNMAASAVLPASHGKSRLPANKTPAASPLPRPLVPRPRPITLKKIMPRNQQVKESIFSPRRSPRISFKEDKENFPAEATKSKRPNTGEAKAKLAPSPLSCLSSLKAEGPPEGRAVLSPASTNEFEFLPNDKRDLAMAKRVRRSYSRLETSFSHSFLENQKSPGAGQTDTSTPNHSLDKRHTLFGFEKLLVPDCVEQANTTAVQKLALTVREPETFTEPDTDIPGICLIKEKKKKKKMPLFAKSDLDEWAARMNAEFEEAEQFNLLVE